MKYLREFIIGSSFPVVAGFFYGAYLSNTRKYTYFHYTMMAPLWFGLWNILSLIISEKYKLSRKISYFIVSILSLPVIFMLAHRLNDKTKEEWNRYYIKRFISYMFVWNIIIYTIDKYI